MYKNEKFLLFFPIFLSLFSCNTAKNGGHSNDIIHLFDGKTFTGWHNFNQTGPVKSWIIEDNALICLGNSGGGHSGDIVTDAEYENFELSWEWKLTKGGNSGVMYHVIEDSKYKAPYETGPEYQIIDDIGFPGKLEEWQKTGCDYAMNLPNNQKHLKAVGEWNTSKIVFDKGIVEHWLNGKKLLLLKRGTTSGATKKKQVNGKTIPIMALQKKGILLFKTMEIKYISKISVLRLSNRPFFILSRYTFI